MSDEIQVVVEPPLPDVEVVVQPPLPEVDIVISEVGLVGPDGPAGPIGPQGPQGPAGSNVVIGGVSSNDMILHVNSPTPHPAYDDGPSLMLLYQNAKV